GQAGPPGEGGQSREGGRSRRERLEPRARALTQPATRERRRQQRSIDDEQHRIGSGEARGGAGGAAEHDRGLDEPRGGGRDGEAGRPKRRLGGRAGGYGAGNRKGRIGRERGQPAGGRRVGVGGQKGAGRPQNVFFRGGGVRSWRAPRGC